MKRRSSVLPECTCRSMRLVLGVHCLLVVSAARAASVSVFVDGKIPQAAFAFEEIQTSLEKKGRRVEQLGPTQLDQVTNGSRIVLCLRSDADTSEKMRVEGATAPGALKNEGYSLRVTSKDGRSTHWVIGADAAGVMYGGLELAEIIRVDGLGSVKDVDHNPYMALRGTKFNIPLDVRTPSYSDVSDAAQNNIPEMWSFDFWKEYIDQLARCRYNFVSLWSLHPFPSLVNVPDYPDVALEDVQRSTVEWQEYYSLNGNGFDSPEILGNVEILKKMTMDEKIAFWRKVMRYGKERNVDFYFVTWNIFVYGTGGKYGITDDISNATTTDYFRKSVKQMFLTYPDLAGIGLTTGENMPGANFQQKEDWAFRTYAQGVLDAAAEQPGRKITFIHRQHQTGAKEIARKFAPLIDHEDIEFIFSFKYAKAHVYSSTTQPYHHGFVEDIGDLKTIWTLRNDDVYYFRWGAPDFVREFIQNIPHEVSRGFYLGSDQYIWGREFLSMEPETPRQIEIVKHWYHWMIWGRLGYKPTLSNERFVKIIQDRYPTISGRALFTAWQEASLIYPTTTGFHWGSLDFQWYIEACKSHPRPAQTSTGFHDVNRFITLAPHPSTDNVSIPDYVDCVVAGKKPSGTTPIEVSKRLHRHADKALGILEGLSHGGNKELRLTMEDIHAMALLGKYYAHKIQGATKLALFRKTKDQVHQNDAVEELTQAAAYWRRYASTALGQYKNPLWTNRVGHCDWRDLFNHVLNDVIVAGGSLRLPPMPPTEGGTILEAEAGASVGLQEATSSSGYTGTGYLDVKDLSGERYVQWDFDAPETGTYILELRYALKGQGQYPCQLTVNGKDCGNIVCWTTGGESTWAWDRKPVVLQKGPNTIKLAPNGPLLLDHINALFGGRVVSTHEDNSVTGKGPSQ
ncbi:carbohydrate-binding family 6 protein [bacterium]|nr:carbohydrate-binding family 6 protein [bacterium]